MTRHRETRIPPAKAAPRSGTEQPLDPGLYLVSTPIGTLSDVTLRALDVLQRADVLAAEDTRRSRQLLDMHGIALRDRRLLSYHDHNGPEQRPVLLDCLGSGLSVACLSDAGTPLIADPGYRLVQEAVAAGHRIIPVPGASALLAALVVAGLPTDRFLFLGFLPPKTVARRAALREVAQVRATLVCYESPHRVKDSLSDMATVLGADRPAVLCRELTKRFEETRRAPLGTLAATLASEPDPRGEIVLLVGPPIAKDATSAEIDAALLQRLGDMSVKDSVREVCEETGAARGDVYARALILGRGPWTE